MSSNYPAELRVKWTDYTLDVNNRIRCDKFGESECNGGDFFPSANSRINLNVHRSCKGNYLRHDFSDIYYTLRILVLFVIFSSSTANIMGDQCDWSGK